MVKWNVLGELRTRLWQIDHIIARGLFFFISFEDKQFKRCWDLKNLQPLWDEDHKKKSKNDIRLIKERKRKINLELVAINP